MALQPISRNITTLKGNMKNIIGTSLVVQRLGVCLPMQGTWVLSLVQEDPTCCGATKPIHPQLLSPRTTTTKAHVP